MKSASDFKGSIEVKEILDMVPELYFAVLKNAHLEQKTETEVICSYELPVLGKRFKTASSIRGAIKAVLVEVSELLTNDYPRDWPKEWYDLAFEAKNQRSPSIVEKKSDRFQSKARLSTIGVTIPVNLKKNLINMAEQRETTFAEVTRQMTILGFEDFDSRAFYESSEKLLSTFLQEVGAWGVSNSEQVMVRLDSHLSVRLRSTAKEYKKSASELSAMCLAHGLFLETKLFEVEEKIKQYQGSAIRKLSPRVGLGNYSALLSGILAGTIEAPQKILKALGETLDAPEFALNSYFKHSFESRSIPAFKAQNGKPELVYSPTPWREAVVSLQLSLDESKELLKMDE